MALSRSSSARRPPSRPFATFSDGEFDPLPPLQVGRVALRVITWDCPPSSTPAAAAQVMVEAAASWISALMNPVGAVRLASVN